MELRLSQRMRCTVMPAVVLAGIFCTLCSPALALRDGAQATWGKTTKVGPDAEAGGWFINLGITGARAKIPDDQPKILEVMYVFKDTPAYGKLKIGDKIVGVNGRAFTTPHKFGYGMDKFGYEGPMMEFGNALEESQGPKLKGQLTVHAKRGDEKLSIELTLPMKYGQFSRTYPYDCKKTDIILRECNQYLVDTQRPDGLWSGRPHLNAFATLALMASGEPRCMPMVKKAVQAMARATTSDAKRGGLPCWQYGMYGATLAEYYLLTGEKWVLPELKEIDDWQRLAQAPRGGWGHSPWDDSPGGKNGYGPINVLTMQAMMAWALMERCGMPIDQKRFAAAHDFVAKGTNKIGYVWYKDGGAGNQKYADMGRTGAAALTHYLSASGGTEYQEFAKLCAGCIGENPKTFPDTHGSPILGMVWTGLGAAADPACLRKLMDYNRWQFALAQCPDGTFYYQPNRDNNPQDFAAAPRLSATAATSLILSLKNKKLQMTGAPLVFRKPLTK